MRVVRSRRSRGRHRGRADEDPGRPGQRRGSLLGGLTVEIASCAAHAGSSRRSTRADAPSARGREDRGRDARLQRGADARAHRFRGAAGVGGRPPARRRLLDRRHRRHRAPPADPCRLAPAQRRLRRQPEDLLPGRAPERRRHRGDAAPRRAVRADADPGARRAHPARRGRSRPRLAARRAGDGEGRRDAALQVRRQPVPDDRRERRHGDDADRAAHRLPRLLAGSSCSTVPFLRNSLDFASTPRC